MRFLIILILSFTLFMTSCIVVNCPQKYKHCESKDYPECEGIIIPDDYGIELPDNKGLIGTVENIFINTGFINKPNLNLKDRITIFFQEGIHITAYCDYSQFEQLTIGKTYEIMWEQQEHPLIHDKNIQVIVNIREKQ